MLSYPNYDSHIKNIDSGLTLHRKNHPCIPSHNFRMFLNSTTGGGKTNLMLYLLDKLISYDYLYIITKSLYDSQFKIFERLAEIYDYINVYDDIKKFKLDDLDSGFQNLIIIDDYQNEKKDEPLVVDCFSRSRHKNASVIVGYQQFFCAPRTIRLNCDTYCFFTIRSETEMDRIRRELCGGDLDKETFIKAYKESTKDIGNFFYINLRERDIEFKYRKCFDQLLKLPEKNNKNK